MHHVPREGRAVLIVGVFLAGAAVCGIAAVKFLKWLFEDVLP